MDENEVKREENGKPAAGGGESSGQSVGENTLTSRRVFLTKAGKVAALAAFAHFALLGGEAYAADACPGGHPDYDVCNHTTDEPDECPGEMPPYDACPANGNTTDDVCTSGLSAADTCNEATNATSDQCPSGFASDDVCNSSNSSDTCLTGLTDQDYCPSDGGTAVDNCWGGGNTLSGLGEMDTCLTNGTGDECNYSKWGSDECKDEHPDDCHFSADVCYLGTNTTAHANGGLDECETEWVDSSDGCYVGYPAEDWCLPGGDPAEGYTDTCIGGGTAVDTCQLSDPDVCVGGRSDNDECKVSIGDEDICPGGGASDDSCTTSDTSDPDICPGGSTSVDSCSGSDPDVPEC